MSVDPIGTDASTGKRFNLYDYANNNPYRYTDPDGRETIEDETHFGGRGQTPFGGIERGIDGTAVRYSIADTRANLAAARAQTAAREAARGEAAKEAQPLLNGPIRITGQGMAHVVERHTANDIAKFA